MTLRIACLTTCAVVASVLLSADARAAGESPEAKAQKLTRRAAELLDQQQYDEALSLLREAQELAPAYHPAQEWLAHAYEVLGDKAQALNHVAALLALQPNSEYGRAAAKRLFYRPPFPRVLNRGTLAVSPVKITVDDGCTLTDERVPGFPAQFSLCYTTSPKYPEDGEDGGPVVERMLPGPDQVTAQFNRVVYGYRETPDTGELKLRVMAYYPSRLLSGSDTDLAETAQALVHLMLRFEGYAEGYLGLPDQGDVEGISRLWLCLDGPPGAERQESDILLYRVLEDERTGLEWIRELAHECGHLLIPPISGFAMPENAGNGEVGERLFLHWLAEEAARWAGGEWPSAQAAARLDAIWPGGGVTAEDYLTASGRAPLTVWAAEGPESELIMGMDERAMQYYVGLVLYVLAAHGADGLRDVVTGCAGTTVADFVYTYRQTAAAWANEGAVTLGVGCFNPAASRLTQAPAAADLTPRSVSLAAGDSITYPVFLPTGTWGLALGMADGGEKLLISFDGSPEVEMKPGAEPIPIGPLNEGWHKLTLRAPADQNPIELKGLTFSQGPVA